MINTHVLPGFTIIKQLGQGSYGTVYKVKRQSDGKSYALKVVDMSSLNQRQREDSVNEIRIMASVQSPFIIRFHEASVINKKLYLITEYAKLGDLSHAISRRKLKRKPFKEDAIWRFMLQTLEGLQVLHDRGIVHRDLKSANILLSAPDLFKVGDLGISTVLQQRQLCKTQIGTPMYLAPEIWKKKPYNAKCDIWSLGVLLYEMATFNYPFNARNARELSVKVCSAKPPRLTNPYSNDLQTVITSMLNQNPALRPTVKDLLNCRAVQSRMNLIEAFKPAVDHSEAHLLETIKVPRNLQMINLPEPRYQKGVDEDLVPLQQRLHIKGKMAEQTRIDLASTRELLMIADNDCWSPNKNANLECRENMIEQPIMPAQPLIAAQKPAIQIITRPIDHVKAQNQRERSSRQSQRNQQPSQQQAQPPEKVDNVNYRPKPPSARAAPNPRAGRVTPPPDQPDSKAPRASRFRYRKPLIIW